MFVQDKERFFESLLRLPEPSHPPAPLHAPNPLRSTGSEPPGNPSEISTQSMSPFTLSIEDPL